MVEKRIFVWTLEATVMIENRMRVRALQAKVMIENRICVCITNQGHDRKSHLRKHYKPKLW